MDISGFSGNGIVSHLFSGGEFFHAYLISGPAGSGKRKLASLMAAAIVCSAREGAPCGKCENCRKAFGGLHPDIFTLERPADKKDIAAEQVRAMRRDVFVVPNEAAARVFIIPRAEDLTTVDQNILLKVLEEPPEYAYFLLAAENPGSLLETVRSRCVELPLHPKAEEPGADPEAADAAETFFAVLRKKDGLALADFLFGLEKLDKAQFTAFLEQSIRTAEKLLKTAETGGKAPLPPEKLGKIITLFRRLYDDTELNISVGHMTGLILAELAEAPVRETRK